jgi:hypothetical protein
LLRDISVLYWMLCFHVIQVSFCFFLTRVSGPVVVLIILNAGCINNFN